MAGIVPRARRCAGRPETGGGRASGRRGGPARSARAPRGSGGRRSTALAGLEGLVALALEVDPLGERGRPVGAGLLGRPSRLLLEPARLVGPGPERGPGGGRGALRLGVAGVERHQVEGRAREALAVPAGGADRAQGLVDLLERGGRLVQDLLGGHVARVELQGALRLPDGVGELAGFELALGELDLRVDRPLGELADRAGGGGRRHGPAQHVAPQRPGAAQHRREGERRCRRGAASGSPRPPAAR